MQLATNQRTLEQNRVFHWVVSTSLFVRLSNGKVEFMHDCISDIMDCMGEVPMLDMGMPKPHAEWLINGSFYSSNGESCIAGQARAQVAQSQKSLNVFGDRQWTAGLPSKPSSFISMPLDYQRAFGGNELLSNPTGIGFKQSDLPNIESSKDVITDNHKPYLPAGFSPLDPSWPQRSQFQGSYDQSYMEKYFPGYPQDMDWRLFMNAPQDQWFDNFLLGNEEYHFENLHPELSHINGQLPGLYPRCFIKDTGEDSPELQFKEVDLHLDTAWFFPDKDIVQLIWRGGMLVKTDEAEQISHLLVGYENSLDEKRSSEHYQQALERRIKAKDPLLDSLNTSDLIPLNAASAMQLLQQSALADAPESELSNNLKAKEASLQAIVEQKVELAINDIKKQIESPNIDQSQKDQLISQLDKLTTTSVPDSESLELKAKLDAILPGVSSGDPSQLDLSDFSFSKMDEIFAELNLFTEAKKQEVSASIQPEINKLKAFISQDDNDQQLDGDKRQQIQQQISDLEAFLQGDEAPKVLSPLPRLDIDPIKQQVANTSPEIQKAQQELHLLLANPLLDNSDVIKNSKEKMASLENDLLSELESQLNEAKKQFFSTYRMSAHFSDTGLSPHFNDEAQKQKLISIANGNKNASHEDWACLDLSNQNLDGIDFSGCLMEQVNFTGASLIGANFTDAILARANLSKANFSQAIFDNANIGASVCQQSNFSAASFDQTKFSRTQFESCDFRHSIIKQPEALEISLNHSNFDFAQIENWSFIEISMQGNTFNQAKIASCTFTNSQLQDCSFNNASLPSTIWANTSLRDSSFQHANMTSNCFVSSSEMDDNQDPSHYERLDFSQANLEKANFQNLDLQKNNFSHSQIASANFAGANLTECNFDDCSGYQAQFRKAILVGASMKRANLMEAVLSKAIITNTNLESSNLYGVDFLRATVKDTRFNMANLDATILRDWRPS